MSVESRFWPIVDLVGAVLKRNYNTSDAETGEQRSKSVKITIVDRNWGSGAGLQNQAFSIFFPFSIFTHTPLLDLLRCYLLLLLTLKYFFVHLLCRFNVLNALIFVRTNQCLQNKHTVSLAIAKISKLIMLWPSGHRPCLTILILIY